MKAIVIGCGVSGLSTGIRLVEAGWQVEIWARELPPHTTSNIAAAIWYPYKALPQDRVLAWGERTLEVFYDLAKDSESGIVIAESIEVFHGNVPEPWWRGAVRDFRFARPDELPAGFDSGYIFETAIIETGIYLSYLMKRFEEIGGKVVLREIKRLDDALSVASVVVNCAGLGTLSFMPDKELFPVRGQIMRIEKPELGRALLDDEEDEHDVLAYIVPRSNDCVLGGTAQAGNWSLDLDEATSQRIKERCARLLPGVQNARVLEQLVGLRPGRTSVRLEVESVAGGTVAHNYGHSGAGITLSWGCAEEVVRLLTR